MSEGLNYQSLDEWDWLNLAEIQELENSEGNTRKKVQESKKEITEKIWSNIGKEEVLDEVRYTEPERTNARRIGIDIDQVRATFNYEIDIQDEFGNQANDFYLQALQERHQNSKDVEITRGKAVLNLDVTAEISEDGFKIESNALDSPFYSNQEADMPSDKQEFEKNLESYINDYSSSTSSTSTSPLSRVTE